MSEIGAVVLNTQDYHAERINGAWQQTVDGILETGRRLLEARQEIEHGAWLPFVQEWLVFGERTARMLLAIADSPRLLNRKHVSALPPSWGTLYKLASLKEEDWEVVEPHISPDMERRDITRLLRDSGRREPPPLPEGKFHVIYADPPWEYGQSVEGYGPADFHYPTMPTDKICEMPVLSLAAPDAVLFLWTTAPKIEEGLEVVRAWGFTYKAQFIWDKIRHNFGHYNSVRHELLLVATRGSYGPTARPLVLHDSVVTIERTEHSRKPERFREIIDSLYPAPGPGVVDRVELFARGALPAGWVGHGDEAVGHVS